MSLPSDYRQQLDTIEFYVMRDFDRCPFKAWLRMNRTARQRSASNTLSAFVGQAIHATLRGTSREERSSIASSRIEQLPEPLRAEASRRIDSLLPRVEQILGQHPKAVLGPTFAWLDPELGCSFRSTPDLEDESVASITLIEIKTGVDISLMQEQLLHHALLCLLSRKAANLRYKPIRLIGYSVSKVELTGQPRPQFDRWFNYNRAEQDLHRLRERSLKILSAAQNGEGGFQPKPTGRCQNCEYLPTCSAGQEFVSRQGNRVIPLPVVRQPKLNAS